MEDKDAAMLVAERIGLQAVADRLDRDLAWARPAAVPVREAVEQLALHVPGQTTAGFARQVVIDAQARVAAVAEFGAAPTAALNEALRLLSSIQRRLTAD